MFYINLEDFAFHSLLLWYKLQIVAEGFSEEEACMKRKHHLRVIESAQEEKPIRQIITQKDDLNFLFCLCLMSFCPREE